MNRFIFLLFIIGMMAAWPLASAAAPVDEVTASIVAHLWFNPQPPGRTALSAEPEAEIERVREFRDDRGRLLAYIVDKPSGGFVIVSADDRVEPVVFFSPDGRCSGLTHPRNPLRALLLADLPWRMQKADRDPRILAGVAEQWSDVALLSINSNDVIIVRDKFTTTQWNQDGMVWDSLSRRTATYNLYTPNFYVAGCVAVAMGQVMKWFQYPARASGSHGIEIDDEDTDWSFDDQFEYDRMPDHLVDGTTPYEIDNVAYLLRDAGIALGMSYTADSGSSSDTADVPDRIKRFFGYSSAQWQSNIFSNHRTEMQSDLIAGFPIMLSIRTALIGGAGHSIVADGFGWYGTTDVYHLNMGWGGSDEGWYPMPGFVADGDTWSICRGFVYNIRPPVIRKVDAMISASEPLNTFRGDDIYGISSLSQRACKPVSPAAPTSFYIMIDNEGTFPDLSRMRT